MSDSQDWAKLKSWHAVGTYTRAPGRAISLCGRSLWEPFLPQPAPKEKSCESCLRVLARRAEAGSP